MKRALASDFDGTLYFGDTEERFHAQDLFTIVEYRHRGLLFGVCTGRSRSSVAKTCGPFIHFDFQILVSGALILDGEGKVLRKSTVPFSLIKELYDRFCDRALVVVQADDTCYTLSEEENPRRVRISSLQEIEKSDLYGVSLAAGSADAAAALTAEVNAAYAGVMHAFQNVSHVDVVPEGCSKGEGLRLVRERLGIDRMGGIGDSFNDLPLLQAADVAFTFASSPEEVRGQADHLVRSVSEALTLMGSAAH